MTRNRWLNLTAAELWCVLWWAARLSRPAPVQPPIVPGASWK